MFSPVVCGAVQSSRLCSSVEATTVSLGKRQSASPVTLSVICINGWMQDERDADQAVSVRAAMPLHLDPGGLCHCIQHQHTMATNDEPQGRRR